MPGMWIGALQIDLRLPEAQSLKEKRFIIRSIVEKVRSRFNVSVTEIDRHDLWQSSLLGVAMIGNDKKHLNEVLDKALDFVRRERRLEVLGSQLDFF